jgi:hypothetical protein
MTMTRLDRPGAFSALAVVLLMAGSCAFAQSPTAKPKDDDLEDLLKKVEKVEKPDKPAEPTKPAEPKAKAKPSAPVAPSDKPKTSGEVSGKDKELDDLLGKIGETKDEPSAEEKKPPMPGGEEDKDKPMPPPPSGGDKKPDDLKGEAKDLDEHLKDLAGKREKKKNQQGQGKKDGQEEGGPLGDLVKQMREVEERLGKPDTGETTRQKQTEIVKKMDTMIEQMRQSKSQSQAMRQMRQGKQPGQQEGQQGNLANGPPATKPEKPKGQSIVALDKNAWGHLPPELRSEMENVFKEDLLPSRADLIKRYYLSVSKKSLSREE